MRSYLPKEIKQNISNGYLKNLTFISKKVYKEK